MYYVSTFALHCFIVFSFTSAARSRPSSSSALRLPPITQLRALLSSHCKAVWCTLRALRWIACHGPLEIYAYRIYELSFVFIYLLSTILQQLLLILFGFSPPFYFFSSLSLALCRPRFWCHSYWYRLVAVAVVVALSFLPFQYSCSIDDTAICTWAYRCWYRCSMSMLAHSLDRNKCCCSFGGISLLLSFYFHLLFALFSLFALRLAERAMFGRVCVCFPLILCDTKDYGCVQSFMFIFGGGSTVAFAFLGSFPLGKWSR